jgi:hypothetical protein
VRAEKDCDCDAVDEGLELGQREADSDGVDVGDR